jgi:hypothetical protein
LTPLEKRTTNRKGIWRVFQKTMNIHEPWVINIPAAVLRVVETDIHLWIDLLNVREFTRVHAIFSTCWVASCCI